MWLSTHGLKLVLVFNKISTSEGSSYVCLHFLLWILPWLSSIGEVELRLDLVESSCFCCLVECNPAIHWLHGTRT
jgi:hypothetical protein